jgi:hypothetical protein
MLQHYITGEISLFRQPKLYFFPWTDFLAPIYTCPKIMGMSLLVIHVHVP